MKGSNDQAVAEEGAPATIAGKKVTSLVFLLINLILTKVMISLESVPTRRSSETEGTVAARCCATTVARKGTW